MKNNSLFLLFLFSSISYYSQKIISGPIRGRTDDGVATFWTLTKDVNSINIIDLNSPTKINSFNIEEDTTVNKYFENLRAYKYQLFYSKENTTEINYALKLNNEIKSTFNFKTTMSNESSFLFGSCAFIGKGFSRGYRPWNMTKIYKTMTLENADYMVWMGDNLYLTLNHDFKNTYSIYRRYLSVRMDKDFNTFLSSNIEHYATWDDHEFGPNNCDGTFKNAPLTKSAFMNFWPNTNYVNNKGIYYSFKKGDIEFFMTDSRTFRRNDGSSLLGKTQLEWLKKSLIESTSLFKIIVVSNQVINHVKGHESYYDFPDERASLINYISEKKIPGILFFSGDRHHSEIQKEDKNYHYPIYDITCSALSSPRPKFRGWGKEGKIKDRISGSFITQHNYGMGTIIGEGDNKKLNISIKNRNQKILFDYSIHMKELGY